MPKIGDVIPGQAPTGYGHEFDDYIAELKRDRAAAPERVNDAYYWVNMGTGWEVAQYVTKYGWLQCGYDSETPDQLSFSVIGPIKEPPNVG